MRATILYYTRHKCTTKDYQNDLKRQIPVNTLPPIKMDQP